jgi:hypothetical protein
VKVTSSVNLSESPATTSTPRKGKNSSPSKLNAPETPDGATDPLASEGRVHSKQASIPDWMPNYVFDNLVVPWIIDRFFIGAKIWDLDDDFFDIVKSGINEAIYNENLDAGSFKLRTGQRFFQFVGDCLNSLLQNIH